MQAIPRNISGIPRDLSFLIQVEPLSPNYGVQPNRKLNAAKLRKEEIHPHKYWEPPDEYRAYFRRTGTLFHWAGGRVIEAATNDSTGLEPYSVATIFTQRPDTPHLLAVNFDATTRDVFREPGGWNVLSFHHETADRNSTYSSLDLLGGRAHLAAYGSPAWMDQLLPSVYDYQEIDHHGHPVPPGTQSAGLIGSLPLLVSLAAFSAPENALADAFRSFQPGQWHRHNHPDGRSKYKSFSADLC